MLPLRQVETWLHSSPPVLIGLQNHGMKGAQASCLPPYAVHPLAAEGDTAPGFMGHSGGSISALAWLPQHRGKG